MLHISKIARASEWWEYKLPPMLSMVYATCLVEEKDLFQFAGRIGVLLTGIVIGAAYVSIINDITDMKEDRASGKQNRLSTLPLWAAMSLVLLTVTLGIFFTIFFLRDTLSIVLYAVCWLSFSLYSIPPFRFKKRGWPGVLADACGAHLFPTLFLLAATVQHFDLPINWLWFGMVGIWALMYGLRGILWHQFYDRSNDLKAGLATYASKKDPSQFKVQPFLLMTIELSSLGFILAYIFKPLPVGALLFYILMLAGYTRLFRLSVIAVVPPIHKPWHFAMNNYYQFLLPLSLLYTLALKDPQIWILIAAHFVLFPMIARNTVVDVIGFFRMAIKKLAL